MSDATAEVRSLLRLVLRIVGVVVAVLVLYVAVTFAQVWNASNADDREQAEVIIVLGAAQYDGRPSPALEHRLDHAVELWQSGVAPTVVVTGGKQAGDRFTEAAASFTYLRNEGIPEGAILREEQGANTWEQLAAATRFLAVRGISSAVPRVERLPRLPPGRHRGGDRPRRAGVAGGGGSEPRGAGEGARTRDRRRCDRTHHRLSATRQPRRPAIWCAMATGRRVA